MNRNEVNRIEIGLIKNLDSNAKVITIEGKEGQENKDLFWRVHCDEANPKCQIIVPPTHNAIFIKDGILQNLLTNGKYPVYETIRKGLFKKVDSVAVDVIFINKTIKFVNKWGTRNPIYSRDPITDLPVTLKGFGEYEVGVDNPIKFYLEIVGLMTHFDLESLQERLHMKMMGYIEPVIKKALHDNFLSYSDISLHKMEINKVILPIINEMFINETGLKVYSFTIDYLMIADEEIQAIEHAIADRKKELKEKEEAKEIAERIDKMNDKEWERKLLLRQLESADLDKYYRVLEILAKNKNDDKEEQDNIKTVCPNCGKEFDKAVRFCDFCGFKLFEDKKYCKNCKRELKKDSLYCDFCGTKVDE